jgi:hypothetical protein
MRVVNASPLIVLSKLGRLNLLREPRPDIEVVTPRAVLDEVLKGKPEDPAVTLVPQPVSRPTRKIILDLDEDSPAAASLERLLDRLKTAIGELGYEAVVEDLISDDLIGGDDSLLASDEVMVIPGHMDDAARPILLAVTRGWGGKDSLSFTKVMRQVKARLIAGNGAVEHVVVFCDA